MIRLLIFDFDGTLADTRELIVATNQEAMRRLQYPVAEEERIVATIGLPLKEGILALFPDLPAESLPLWVDTYREVFDGLKGKIVPALFPEVRETLQALCAQGYRCTVASSRGSVSLNDFLREMGIAPFISYVLGADNVTKAKPDPEPVLKTLRDLSFPAAEALVVGDMPVDISMGLGAGAFTCGVSYGNASRSALLAAGAHHVIDSFGALRGICRRFLQP